MRYPQSPEFSVLWNVQHCWWHLISLKPFLFCLWDWPFPLACPTGAVTLLSQTPTVHSTNKCSPKCEPPGRESEFLDIEYGHLCFQATDLGFLHTGRNLCLRSACPARLISLHSLLGQLHAWHFLSIITCILINHNHSFQLKITSWSPGPLYPHLLYISPGIIIPHHTHSNVCS